MESQVQKLKLNVNNIKSYLIRSNKELKGLKVQKRDLFSRIEKKREFREEEKRIETPNLGIGAGFAKISSAVTSPVRSIFDQIDWSKYVSNMGAPNVGGKSLIVKAYIEKKEELGIVN